MLLKKCHNFINRRNTNGSVLGLSAAANYSVSYAIKALDRTGSLMKNTANVSRSANLS